MTPAAPRHIGPEFGCEIALHLPVRIARVEERHELLGSGASVQVEGEQTAVLAVDVASQTLQLSPVMVPYRAVASQESLDVRH